MGHLPRVVSFGWRASDISEVCPADLSAVARSAKAEATVGGPPEHSVCVNYPSATKRVPVRGGSLLCKLAGVGGSVVFASGAESEIEIRSGSFCVVESQSADAGPLKQRVTNVPAAQMAGGRGVSILARFRIGFDQITVFGRFTTSCANSQGNPSNPGKDAGRRSGGVGRCSQRTTMETASSGYRTCAPVTPVTAALRHGPAQPTPAAVSKEAEISYP